MPRRGYRTTAAGFVAAVALLSAVGVAGCDSHSKPTVPTEAPQSPDPVVSPSATLSPSPSVASSSVASGPTPPLPTTQITGVAALTSAYPSAAAAEPAAVQIVRTFFAASNRQIQTGDQTAISKTFRSTCDRCISGVVAIGKILDGNHTIRGGAMHLISIDRVFPSYSNIVTVVVTDSEDAAQQIDSNGKVVQSFPAVPPTQLAFDVLVDARPPVIVSLTRTTP